MQRVFVVDLLAVAPFYDRYLVDALSARIDDVRFYAATYPYEPRYFDEVGLTRAPGVVDVVARLGIEHKTRRRALQTLEYAYNWRRLLRDVRRERPDVVHVQWLPLLEATAFELWCVDRIRAMGVPVVYTAHNALPHDSGERHAARFGRLYDTVDRILVHSPLEKSRVESRQTVTRGNVHVVPHGPVFHDLPSVDAAEARRALGLGEGPVVLDLGIVRPYKGVEELLRALVPLAARHPDVQLLLAGQGEPSYLASLRELARTLGVERHVTFRTRYVPVSEIPLLHAAADVVALPYRSASQSGALLTAAGRARPVVATRVGGFTEVLDEAHGTLVPPGDSDALAAALARVLELSREERERAGAALRDHVMQTSSWERNADRTLEVYALACASRA